MRHPTGVYVRARESECDVGVTVQGSPCQHEQEIRAQVAVVQVPGAAPGDRCSLIHLCMLSHNRGHIPVLLSCADFTPRLQEGEYISVHGLGIARVLNIRWIQSTDDLLKVCGEDLDGLGVPSLAIRRKQAKKEYKARHPNHAGPITADMVIIESPLEWLCRSDCVMCAVVHCGACADACMGRGAPYPARIARSLGLSG